MDPRWAKFVTNYITIRGNKAQVITLKGLPCGDLGIINIYAPNNYVDKNILWELLEKFPRDYSWIVCGDLNMVEYKEDKSSMCGRLIPNKEILLWDALNLALEIHEPTRSNRSLKFSWDNQRSGGERIMARLDYIYIPNYLASNQANDSPCYYVRGDGVKSNRHHVSCLLEIVKIVQRTSMWKMNTRFFEEVKKKIHKIWKAQSEGATFFIKLRKAIRFYREFCKVKATKFYKEDYELKQNLECIQSSLQDMVQDKGLQQLTILKQRINELKHVKVAK